MSSLSDIVKYVGLAVIIYLLSRAFTHNQLDHKQSIIFTLIVLGIVFLLHKSHKNKCATNEKYQITDPPIVSSIYPGPDNTEFRPEYVERPNKEIKYEDPDINDFKDIMRINKDVYEKLIDNEERAENKIRKKYRDEMVYTKSHPFNTIPLGTQLYGYTYLPPENWFRAYERPPVCVTDKKCPVCPITSSNVEGLMEFDTGNNILGASGLDLRYIKHVLNKD